LEEDLQRRGRGRESEEDDRPAWERHTSAWKIKKKKDSIDHVLGEDDRVNNLNDEEQEVGESSRLLVEDSDAREARRERIATLAINSEVICAVHRSLLIMSVNTIVNILLVAAKAVAVLYSASISLTASLVDSALDLLSTFIILGTSWAIGSPTDKHKVRPNPHCIGDPADR
jgi:hypothetical protein